MTLTRRALIAAPIALAVSRAAATGLAAPDGLEALAAPGAHAIMRHARAPGTGDPSGFRLDDPSTQRNLSDAGRAQALAAGEMLRAAGARFDAVLTSQWRRCAETAELLALGPVTEAPPLNSFFERRAEGAAQTRATLALLRGPPEGARAMLVTHQVNVTALTGVYPASGEIVVFRLEGDGVAVLGRVTTG